METLEKQEDSSSEQIETKYINIFVKNVTSVIESKNRSMRWLSITAGLNGSTVFRMLKGQIKPSLASCIQISKALDVSLQWLFTEHNGNLNIPNSTSNYAAELIDISDRLDIIDRKINLVLSIVNETKKRTERGVKF